MMTGISLISMKKTLLLAVMMTAIVISGCVTEPIPPPNPVDVNDTNMSGDQTKDNSLEFIILDKEGTIEPGMCSLRKLDDKIIVLESRYCGACRIAVPILKEIEEELSMEFIFLDLSKQYDSDRLKEFRIMPQYTPTVLIGCDVHIGAKSKEVYKEAIEEFLGR